MDLIGNFYKEKNIKNRCVYVVSFKILIKYFLKLNEKYIYIYRT